MFFDFKNSIKQKKHFFYSLFILVLQAEIFLLINQKLFSKEYNFGIKNISKENIQKKNLTKDSHETFLISEINWDKTQNKNKKNLSLKWIKITPEEEERYLKTTKNIKSNFKPAKLRILNRSIIFNDKYIGPDIAWLVPPGLKWNSKYKFDFSSRGHSRRKKGESFLGWNEGDAVGQIYYQPFHSDRYSFGLNLGIRSLLSNANNGSDFGEGLSMGFRLDYEINDRSGIAFGGEQLLHFDGLTDTGRDLYITASKGWWYQNIDNVFPLNIATLGFASGKMAEGNIKGLCSDLLGGSGTEIANQRSLCFSPVFSLARVHNEYFSTFFEYNSKDFLLGNSVAPFKNIPIRGTFAIVLSDHIDNYKLHNFNELRWVFRVSMGF